MEQLPWSKDVLATFQHVRADGATNSRDLMVIPGEIIMAFQTQGAEQPLDDILTNLTGLRGSKRDC